MHLTPLQFWLLTLTILAMLIVVAVAIIASHPPTDSRLWVLLGVLIGAAGLGIMALSWHRK
jgi:hypothetical protein